MFSLGLLGWVELSVKLQKKIVTGRVSEYNNTVNFFSFIHLMITRQCLPPKAKVGVPISHCTKELLGWIGCQVFDENKKGENERQHI